MTLLYRLFRIACFVGLPLFFYTKELMPQPVQSMLFYFLVAVLVSEILLFFIRFRKSRTIVVTLPLLAVLAGLFPYKSDLEYFASEHLLIIYFVSLLSVIYFVDGKYIYPRICREN